MYTYTDKELTQEAKSAAREKIATAKSEGRADSGRYISFCLGLPGVDVPNGHVTLIVHFTLTKDGQTWSSRTNVAI